MVDAPADLRTQLHPDGGPNRVFPAAYARHAEHRRDPLLPTVGRWRLVGFILGLILAFAGMLAWRLAIRDSLQHVETILAIEPSAFQQRLDE